MNVGFQFEVTYRDNDLIEVRACAWNGVFGGRADVYVGKGQLEEVATKLKGFPGNPSDSREVVLGAFGSESAGGGLRLRFYCADKSGHTYVEAKIQSGDKLGGPVESVSLLVPIEAAAVDSFVEEVCRLGVNEAGVARLDGIPP